MDSYESLIRNLKEITVDLIPIREYDYAENSNGYGDFDVSNSQDSFCSYGPSLGKMSPSRFDDRFRPLIREEEDLLRNIQNNEIEIMKSKKNLLLALLLFLSNCSIESRSRNQ
jgi:hypothetical protein